MKAKINLNDVKQELLNREVRYSTLKLTVRSLPKAYREYANRYYENLDKWLYSKIQKEEEKALRKQYIPLYRKAGLAFTKHRGKAEDIVYSFRHCTGYSMGEIIYLEVNGVVIASYDNTSEYASSCRSKAKHGAATIKMTTEEFQAAKMVGGLVTIVGEEREPGIYSSKYLDNMSLYANTKIIWRSCYLIDNGDGTFHHSFTLSMAIAYKRGLKEKIKKVEAVKAIKAREFVGIQDSETVGNCLPGTKAFIQRHGLNPEWGYSKTYLKSLEPDNPYLARLF